MPGIIDLPKFNCEDLEEIVAGGQGSFGVTYMRTTPTPLLLLFIPYKFSVDALNMLELCRNVWGKRVRCVLGKRFVLNRMLSRVHQGRSIHHDYF